MSEDLTIGKVSRLTGLPTKTIRFYEDEGLVPPPARSDAGYRLYTPGDVTRLQLVRGARLLGVDLAQIRSLLDKALGETCAVFGDELNQVLAVQLVDVERRIVELTTLHDELVRLQTHVTHCCEGCSPGQMAAECNFCELLTPSKGGEPDAHEHDDR